MTREVSIYQHYPHWYVGYHGDGNAYIIVGSIDEALAQAKQWLKESAFAPELPND